MSLTLAVGLRTNKPKRNVEIISAGNLFSIAIQKNGRLWGWGYNYNGQLGDNTTISKITPVNVAGAVKTFCQIDAGSISFSMAIDKNGRAWGWGNNQFGNLGNNTTVSQRTPVSVLGAVKTFCKISAGGGYSSAIARNGRAWGWGANQFGNLGNNAIVSQRTPVSVLGAVKTFCQISAGNNHTLAIDKNGRAWGWGNNGSGALGNNAIVSQRTPVSVLGAVKTFCQISAGTGFSSAIARNGRAWSWGLNTNGQLGNNTTVSQRTPVSVLGAVKTFCQISAGASFTLAIDKNGRAWGWGYNQYGQLGDNTVTQKNTPVSVAGAVKTFCRVSAGADHTLAIDKNGRAWGWGNNGSGQLGAGGIKQTCSPMTVRGQPKTFCQINAGGNFTGALDKNYRFWTWGNNSAGQLGNNQLGFEQSTPVSVLGAVKTFCQIDTGGQHVLAIDKNGRAWGWGGNVFGEVGDNTAIQKNTPVSIAGAVKTFCKISGAGFSSAAIDKYGRAWGWGANYSGQLGNNTLTLKYTPVSVVGAIKTFCQISTGGDFSDASTLAIDKNGRAWGWGYNYFGALGDNTGVAKCTPVSVVGAVKTFCQISAGKFYTMAIDKNGRAWGWGYNGSGRLGDNTTTVRRTPVSVRGAVKTFCKISAGGFTTVAIDKNGRVWAWGLNSSGQLGDNTTTERCTPVSVVGAIKTFCQISAGASFTLAIDKNGRAWGWGQGASAQLGMEFFTSTRTPVRVCNI